MNQHVLTIHGVDPLLFRDGRPFGAEPGAFLARTMRLPYPSTLAGMLRAHIGTAAGWRWTADDVQAANAIAVQGPLLRWCGQTVYPAPADALVVGEQDHKVEPLRLRPEWREFCDLPDGLTPLCPQTNKKPVQGYDFWPEAAMETWLAGGVPELTKVGTPMVSTRTSVQLETGTRLSKDGHLFAVEGVHFREVVRENAQTTRVTDWSYLTRISGAPDGVTLRGGQPFGGERRVAALAPDEDNDWPAPPEALTGSDAMLVRLILATPAVFADGWKPGWLSRPEMAPPWLAGFRFKLIAAAVPRRQAVSGWDYRTHDGRRPGPKPVKWLAPAGSVYYLQIEEGGTLSDLLAQGWLESVSDDEQDRRDGFGLALWGLPPAGSS